MHQSVINGLKGPLLGAGIRSEVFAIDDDWVVKRMHDECDGFHVITQLSQTFIERFQLPRIDFSRSILDEGIIVIERLHRTPWDVWEGSDEVHNRMNDLQRLDNDYKKKFRVEDWIEKTHPLFDITLKAFKAWKILNRIGYPVSLDINPSNVMMRKGDKKLILSDPFGYLDI